MKKNRKNEKTPHTPATVNADTIVAVATPPGRGGVSVLRVSGSHTQTITKTILKKIIPSRQAVLSRFYAPGGEIIDRGIALYFQGPHSFTGEDVLELHVHGSPVVTDWLMESILQAGARMARHGEFSERAFLNGKMDLTEAEAVADLIDSSSRAAAKCAMRSLQGAFSGLIQQAVESLTALRVQVEAMIDFSDEDIDFKNTSELTSSLEALIRQINTVMHQANEGSRLCRGIRVVIAGPPNAGKSSLLNCLSGREAAIVTDIPGTTRDVLREHILLEGFAVQLVDTAGLRDDSVDAIEQEGIRRTGRELEEADMVLYVCEADSCQHDSFPLLTGTPYIIIRNKIDLTAENPTVIFSDSGQSVISLSVRTGEGVDLLIQEIRRFSGHSDSEGVFSARRRHLDALRLSEDHLVAAQQHLPQKQMLDCVAEELRLAQQRLCEITGAFVPDDLLGKIFSSFCIGK